MDHDPPIEIGELHHVVDGTDLVLQGESSKERIRSDAWEFLECVR